MELSFAKPVEVSNPNKHDYEPHILCVDEYVKKDIGLESPKDKAILDLAKRRVEMKRNLFGQVIDFCLLLVLMLCLIGMYSEDGRVVLSGIFAFFWGVRLIIRLVRYAKPSFKNGIAAYFKERKQRKIEFEYSKLKKMSKETFAELSDL